MDSAAAPMLCAQAEEATVYGLLLSAEPGGTGAAGVVGGLPMPTLVACLPTSCREGRDVSGMVQSTRLVQPG